MIMPRSGPAGWRRCIGFIVFLRSSALIHHTTGHSYGHGRAVFRKFCLHLRSQWLLINRELNHPAIRIFGPYSLSHLALKVLYAQLASMVTINVAYTTPVNPPGATPMLTREQLWTGMERKVRRAHDFVPVFEDCKVIEEHDNVIVRETKLKPMEGRPGKTQQETCKLYKPTKVCHVRLDANLSAVCTDCPRSTSTKRAEPPSPTWSLMVPE